MIKPALGILLVLFSLNLFAQMGVDSLLQELDNAKSDTQKVNLLNKLSAKYYESKPVLTFKYSSQALALSRIINYAKGEADATHEIGISFFLLSDYPTGLEYNLNALKKAEALGDNKLIAGCLMSLGVIYTIQEDYQKALSYTLKADSIYEELHNEHDLAISLVNTGNIYNNLDQLDSARVFLNRALEISLRIKDEDNEAGIYLNFGLINIKMKHYDIASAYLKQGIPNFEANSNHLFLYSTYYYLAQIFDSTGHYDSAYHYSKLAFHQAYSMGSPIDVPEIAQQLSSIFKQIGKTDSAFHYLDIAMAAKDSLRSREKEKKIEILSFNEQLRQMQIEEQKLKDAETRKRNLQFAGITIFIPLFFIFILLLSKRKVKPRTIEFLAVLGLLFLYEFIVLFAHPYIGHWTNDSPIFMLLIFVLIASVLVPLHHRTEKWMKERLAHKPYSIQQPEFIEEPVESNSSSTQ